MISMGRRPRIHYPGAVYHAMARGVDGRDIFIDDEDRRYFLRSLDRIKLETGAIIYAYCLMSNHFHLALKVAAVPLSGIIQRILTGYSITFNGRHGRTGHLFQARYKSILCRDDRYLLGLIRYIQMNPVRAGLVHNSAEWAWSSRSPVHLPNLEADGFNPWPSHDVAPTMMRPPMKQDLTIQEIGARIAASAGMEAGALRSNTKCRHIVDAKMRLSVESIKHGHTIEAISTWLNCQRQSVSYYLRKNSTNLSA